MILALLAKVTFPPLASADPTAKCSGSAHTTARIVSSSTYSLSIDRYPLGILKDEDPLNRGTIEHITVGYGRDHAGKY